MEGSFKVHLYRTLGDLWLTSMSKDTSQRDHQVTDLQELCLNFLIGSMIWSNLIPLYLEDPFPGEEGNTI